MSYSIETYELSKKFPAAKRYRELILHPFQKKESTALHNINIQINKGELFGLLGPNGAGKTTLIKILCTLILPTSGKALVNGLEVSRYGKEIRKAIGYVIADERSFYWRLSGRQNLNFFSKLNNIPAVDADRKISELLDFMELTCDADRPFKDYSTGMRQKLAIARGLITNPEIIFMDEPTNGLDPVISENLKKLIKINLVEGLGKTVVFASHNLQDVEELCNRIAIIQNGEVRLSGSVEDIKKKFSTEKKYVMCLKNQKNGLIDKISSIPHVKNVLLVSNSSFSENVKIEVEITGNNGGISSVIKEIVDVGGEFNSFSEKKHSLGELFPKIVMSGAPI